MSEHNHDTSFKWLMFFFVCFASSVFDVPLDSPGAEEEHQISKDEVMSEMNAAGFTLDREVTFLPEQYFLIFKSISGIRNGVTY